MADHEPEAPQPVINALLASGFPFQTAVARLVRQVDGCTVAAEEFPWRDETGNDQFLDLVVVKDSFVVTVECKKTQKDILAFLQPGGTNRDVTRARCVYLTQMQDSTHRLEFFCSDWWLMPKSAESAFCVVSTSPSGKDQRMLERDVQRLVRGTDAYGQRFKGKFRLKYPAQPHWIIIPMVVTNAKLFVADYQPADVSLETGQLSMPPPATISPVEWIRFRKAFTSGGKNVGDRTVLVVAAAALTTLLGRLDMIERAPSEDGKVHLP